MRLSISNIAWDPDEDEVVAALLQRHGVNAIDVAPGKYFPQPQLADAQAIADVRASWADRGIDIIGMQALLFGTTGLNVFGPGDVQQALLDHLSHVCRIGAGLGATRLVFGSPRNRDRTGLSDEQARAQGAAFFRRVGDIAAAQGVMVCLEPNPAHYGANFMTGSLETAEVVEAVGHPAIRMQLDTGAIAINREDPAAVIERCAGLIGHVHLSEPDLVPLGDGGADHVALAAALARHLPQHPATIEMLATVSEPHPAAIARALAAAAPYRALPTGRS